MNELQSRHWEDVDVSKIDQILHKDVPATEGGSGYVSEDGWE